MYAALYLPFIDYDLRYFDDATSGIGLTIAPTVIGRFSEYTSRPIARIECCASPQRAPSSTPSAQQYLDQIRFSGALSLIRAEKMQGCGARPSRSLLGHDEYSRASCCPGTPLDQTNCSDSRPFVIPTSYGRDGTRCYIHGSSASRMLRHAEEGFPICMTVTILDAIVLAKSAFNHSMNYRSVVILGKALPVEDAGKIHALKVISDRPMKSPR
jgi:hypothetical protein